MQRLRTFLVGLVIGGATVAGIGPAVGGGDRRDGGGQVEWGLAPMEAKVGTFLYRHGFCKDPRRTPVVGTAGPAQYVCKAKFKPPPPP